MPITLVMPSSHLILWHFLLLLSSIFPSIRDFSNQLAVCVRWQNTGVSASASATVLPGNIQGWSSLRFDWFDLLAVQGTLRCLLQHHSLKASILWHSAFFMVQLSKPYMTTGKTMALTIRTFVSREMSLLFNTLSKCVIFPGKKQTSSDFVAAVTIHSDFRLPKEEMSLLPPFPLYLPWINGARCHDLKFLVFFFF